MTSHLARCVSLLAAVAVLLAAGCARPAPTSPRHTGLVDIFAACKDSVVKFTATRVEEKKPAQKEGTKPPANVRVTHTQWGSGCILHRDGYVLTNSHMLRFEGRRKATLYDGTSCPCHLVAADDVHDLAVLKLEGDRTFTPLRLGRSSDVMVGEPAITIGSPFGISFTMAAGIISGHHRGTRTDFADLHDMIQTDASINPGTSGGPLLNAEGKLIGICTSSKREADNIAFAIPIDRARALLPDILAVEGRYGFHLGLAIAAGEAAIVESVADASPAHTAGIEPGDLVTAVDGEPVESDLDFHFALVGRKGGQTLPFALRRKGRTIHVAVTLGEVPLRPADAPEALVSGLRVEHYAGRWSRLPDFATLQPAATSHCPTFDLAQYKGTEAFALRFTGYVQVPSDGSYAFYTRSDDGSRLYIADQLVVDNDGLHAAASARGFIALSAGKHAITVTFFEAGGDDELAVSYEGQGLPKQEIPASALFRAPPPPKP